MKKTFISLVLLVALAIAACAQEKSPAPSTSTQEKPQAPSTHLKIGDAAPDFELTDTTGKKVKLSDFKGKKNVALAFYVLAFTGG
jgi:cytochrome oxidase Cu insertion factor (SCO1/SenC/PrrC family)